ncbi:MAG: hypothetical protein JW924_11875 [Fusobacteriaceae bacterium]|nr:hypothetical protein [Fusobacteriaceae bacterium]
MNNFWTAARELSSKLFFTYAIIDKLTSDDIGYCFAKNESIGKKADKHPSNISKAISELIELKYLYVLEIKVGFVVSERRLYTERYYKKYLEDKENATNLWKTYYEEIGEIIYYYNERNPHPKFHKEYIENLTNGKIANGTQSEIATGTDGEIAKYNCSYNNLTNKTEITEEPDSDIDKKSFSKTNKIKKVLEIEKINLDDSFITELSNKYDFELIVKLIQSIPKDTKNHGGYLRGIIKNLNVIPKKETLKAEINEEKQETVKPIKKSRDSMILEFCQETNCQIGNIPNYLKNILNKALKESNYEQI